MEREKGSEAPEEGRRGGGGGRGERPARGGRLGEWLPSPRPAGTGENEREAAEEDVLQEEQNGKSQLRFLKVYSTQSQSYGRCSNILNSNANIALIAMSG